MKIFYSREHEKHFPRGELYGGALVTPFERPSRMETILGRLNQRGFRDIQEPDALDMGPVRTIHDADYLRFLGSAWQEWVAEGFEGEIIPTSFPVRRMPGVRCPRNIDGKAGYYALAAETSITEGTWDAARKSCSSAQCAQRHAAAEGHAFALCRPPGHHAMKDMYGGYCFVNNAAVAAQMFIEDGASRVAVLDVDFHHGNGTQDIFYDRGDVLFASLHGHPEDAFPYFMGYADERGVGEGEDCNINLPMRPGTGYGGWSEALDHAVSSIRAFGAEALVVSLGVDAYKHDPISFFQLETEDFVNCGQRVAKIAGPTVIVMEGGYALEEIGVNTVGFLEGWLDHQAMPRGLA